MTLELRQAEYAPRGRTRLHATSLTISPASITAIVGRNGAGKSTLLALMAAEVRPTSGSVFIDGESADSLSAQSLAQRRALLTQDQAVSFSFTVRDVVSWGRHCWAGTSHAQHDDQIIDSTMNDQGVAHLSTRLVTELSGGERQRVHVARVRAQRAPVLLLDEADAALDLEGRHHLVSTVREEALSGTAVVMVSHDVHRMFTCADRMLVVDGGRVVMDSSPASIDRKELARVLGVPEL
jgi:iron complex transport system ATP-binding protein